jgi:reactive intermediate/imine deaminase
VGDFVLCSGQIPLDPASGAIVAGDFAAQARRVLDNLSAVVGAAGLSMADVVRTTIYLTDLADFAVLNEIYAEYFAAPFPARSTVQVAALPRGARVEIDAMAYATAPAVKRPS